MVACSLRPSVLFTRCTLFTQHCYGQGTRENSSLLGKFRPVAAGGSEWKRTLNVETEPRAAACRRESARATGWASMPVPLDPLPDTNVTIEGLSLAFWQAPSIDPQRKPAMKDSVVVDHPVEDVDTIKLQ